MPVQTRDEIDDLVDWQLGKEAKVRYGDNDYGVVRELFSYIDDLYFVNWDYDKVGSHYSGTAATWSAREGVFVQDGALFDAEDLI